MGVKINEVLNQQLRNAQDDTSSYAVNPNAIALDGRGILSPDDVANPNLILQITQYTIMPGETDATAGDPQTWVGGAVNKFGDPVYPQFGANYADGQIRPARIWYRIDTLGQTINYGWEVVETTL